jgi:hypothetical protein
MSSICRDRLGTNTQGKQTSKKERLRVFAGHDEIANGAHGDPGWVSFVLNANKSSFCVLFAFCAFCLCPEPVLGTLYRAILMRKRNQQNKSRFLALLRHADYAILFWRQVRCSFWCSHSSLVAPPSAASCPATLCGVRRCSPDHFWSHAALVVVRVG